MKRNEGSAIILMIVAVLASFLLGRSTVDKQSKVQKIYVTVPTVSTTTTTVPSDCEVKLPGGYVLHTDKQSAFKNGLHCG